MQGFVEVVARVWGEDRKMQLIACHGYHVQSQSCDDGPMTTMLLLESDIVEGLEKFSAFKKKYWDDLTSQMKGK